MNHRSARIISLIETVTWEEEGDTAAQNYGRLVRRYYSTDGDLLAVNDPVVRPVGDEVAQSRKSQNS